MENVNDAAKSWSDPETTSLYEKIRPDYNLDSVKYLLEKVGALKKHSGTEPFTIVELGAGTGKFTRAVLKVLKQHYVQNFKIIATEPIKSMCDKFKEMVPEVEIIQCSASDLSGLPNKCTADAVLAAQCFHWFGMEGRALDEIHQLIKPQGTLGIIWNLPDRSVSWIRTFEEWLDPKFKATKIPRPADAVMFVPLRNHGGFGNELIDETTFKYSMDFDMKSLINRYESNSVVSAATPEEKKRILSSIENELKNNKDTKDKEIFSYQYVVKIHCFQKL